MREWFAAQRGIDERSRTERRSTTDPAALPNQLTDDFEGPADMLGVWGTIDAVYDVAVEPSEFLAVDDTRVVVIGRYRGPARDGDSTVDAAFAHVITTRGDRVATLHQITDTARWGFPVSARP